MKILIISNNNRTINIFRKDIIKELSLDHDIYIIAKKNEPLHNSIIDKVKYTNININNDNNNLFNEIRTFLRIFFFTMKNKPDLGIFYTIKPNLYGSIIFKFLKIQYIANLFGFGYLFIHKNKLVKKFFLRSVAFISKNAFRTFVQNKYDSEVVSKLSDTSSRIIEIPGSGINLSKYYAAKENLNKYNYDFTFIGRIIKDKGVDEFIDAAININQLNKNLKFCIQGEFYGSNKKRSIDIKKFNYAVENKIIDYYEFGNTNSIIELINNSKWIVLPSYREGSSKVLQESIALSTPCLASDVPGCNQIIVDKFNGFLFKSRSVSDLTDKLLQAAELSDDDYKFFSENSFISSEKYSHIDIINKVKLEIHNFILSKRKLFFIQLNEFTYEFYKKINENRPLTHFSEFFNNSEKFYTNPKVDHKYNEPWIQWYTISTGLNHDDHQVFSLGESLNQNHNQIWETLENHNLKVAAISPMNGVNRLTNSDNLFLADPWTKTKSFASKLDLVFYNSIKTIIISRSKDIKYLKNVFLFLFLSFKFLKTSSYLIFFKLLFKSIVKPWSRVFLLDFILLEFLINKNTKNNYNFSSIFFNGLAHLQHHYLYSSKDLIKDNSDNDSEDIIRESYIFYDYLMHRIKQYADKNNISLFFASGLSQKITQEELYYYSFNKNYEKFFKQINIKYSKFNYLMSREARIEFNNENDKNKYIKYLNSILDINNNKIFEVINENKTNVKITIIYSSKLNKNIKIYCNDKILINDFDNYILFWARKNGDHSPKGIFCTYDKFNKVNALESIKFIEITELFNMQRSFFTKINNYQNIES